MITSESRETGTELELGLIAACWGDSDNAQLLLGTLTETDFSSMTGLQQFRVLRKCWQEFRNSEVPSLKKVAADHGVIESWHFAAEAFASGKWGGYGPGYLRQLMSQVRSNSGRVRVSMALRKASEIIADHEKSLEEVTGEISQMLTAATAVSIRHNAESWHDGLTGMLERIEKRMEAQANGQELTESLDTGIGPLDRVMGGLGESELIVIAARPRVGKTAFGLQVATSVAERYGPVLFLSLELSRQKMWSRVAVQQSGYPLKQIYTRPDLVTAVRERNTRLWIDDTPLKPDQLQQRIELFRLEHPGLRAVFLDHLGILAGDGADYKSTSYASNMCRRAMKATGLPVVVLVQINRKAEERNGGRPSLADIKMSGCIEEDARKVLLLHRPPLYSPGKCDPFEALAIVAKNGEGEEGDVDLNYNAPLFTFGPPTRRTEKKTETYEQQHFDVPEDMF